MVTNCLELRIFNAEGDCLLEVPLSGKTHIHHARIPAGDVLVAFRAHGRVEATGGFDYPTTRTIDELPERPLLDEIMQLPRARAVVPRFVFSS